MASDGKLLTRARDFFDNKVVPWWTETVCRLPKEIQPFIIPFLLSAIYLQLREMADGMQFGANSLRIQPVTLGPVPVKLVDRDIDGKARKVQLWVDSASGGPFPLIRISTGATGTAGGGISVIPGQMNDLDMVPANVTLWGAADSAINAYVVIHT